MENEVDIMTVKEIARLSDWLTAKGHTPEEIIDCIHYIARTEQQPDKRNQVLPPLPMTEEPD